MGAKEVVLGIDSSTQSTKVLVVDLARGEILAEGRAPHTGNDTQDPDDWWRALQTAARSALADDHDVRALSVAAQQHGLVTLDDARNPVCPAPLWNNTDAAPDAERLDAQADFAGLVGTRPVASVTIAKLAHLARVAPDDLEKTDAVALPHDFLNMRLTGRLASDRGDASGTGWWSPSENRVVPELLELAIGPRHASRLRFPDVLGPDEVVGELTDEAAEWLDLPANIPVAVGTGDNMGAALGVGTEPGELVVSLGRSGTTYAVSERPTTDKSGEVAGFADATGRYLPLACLLNCTRVLDSMANLFGLTVEEALDIAGDVPPGSDGLMLIPYFSGERTPNLPDVTGQLLGMTSENFTRANAVRSAVDGIAAGLAYCLEALDRVGIVGCVVELVGGGSAHPSWQQAIADASGIPVELRTGLEHVARGAAVQAAAVVLGEPVREVAARWRPAISARIEPRADFQEAFKLDRRREIVQSLMMCREPAG